MKIKYLIIFLFAGIILSGLATGVFIPALDPEATHERLDQKQDLAPESYTVASISKGTILMLLAVGVIGALGVSRKKKDTGNDLDRHTTEPAAQLPRAKEKPQKLITRNS